VVHRPRVHDRAALEEAGAEIEGQIVAHHDEEALMGGLVEAELLLDAGDQRRVQPLSAAIFDVLAAALAGQFGQAAGRAHVAARAAAEAGGGARVRTGQLGDHLFHRPARGHLHDGEVDHQDAEQGRDDQHQPAQDVGGHQFLPRAAFSFLALSASSHHRSSTPRE
jgi:hypothetical protein